MKKIALGLTLVSFFLFQTIARADTTPTQTLIAEDYNASSHTIYRIYENDQKKQTYTEIFVPAAFTKSIETSDQPLLEAKKQLAFYYAANGMELEKKELDNTFNLRFSSTTTYLVSQALQSTFAQQKADVDAYVQTQQAAGAKVTEKPTVPTYHELQTSMEKKKDTNLERQTPLKLSAPDNTIAEVETPTPWLKWTAMGIVILSLTLSIWWMLRRPSDEI